MLLHHKFMKPVTLPSVIAAVVVSGAHAHATSMDSAPACVPSRAVPRLSPLPANAPAIVLVPYQTPASAISLEDEDGMPVAVQFGEWAGGTLIRPLQPLKPGLHTIKFLDACKDQPPRSIPGQATIMVGAAVPLPTTIGSVTSPSLSSVSTCPGANATVDVDLTLSPELRAYRELSLVGVSTEEVWRVGSYQDSWLESPQQHISIPVSCEEGATINRTIVIRARVAGTTEEQAPPPIRVNASAVCPPKSEWVPCSHDGGTFYGDAGIAAQDAGANAPIERNPAGGSGCKFGGNGRASTSFPGIFVVLASVGWLIRRRAL